MAVAAQSGRLFLWLPVALGAGCATYLALRFEPDWVILALAVAMSGVLVWLLRRFNLSGYAINFAWLCLVFALGLCLCKLRSERVAAPVLKGAETQFRIEAVVIDVTGTDRTRPKLLVAPLRISGLAPEDTPIRLRLSLRQAFDVKPGQTIKAFAILNPPAAPNIPGGYDFARTAWFEAIGGVGFVPGRVTVIETPELSGRLQRITALNLWRWNMTERIVTVLDGQWGQGTRLGGFAAALVTGHQAYLEPDLVQTMRDSGLAHILSISGLHMAIVGGFAFFFSRFIFALMPSVALRYPIKKWAAAIGILSVCLYLALSGAPAPAIRAAIVAVVAFGAILLDRRALSLRALALAAIIVLLLSPEAVFEPGFQMSFCATAALLALAETVRPAPSEISVPIWVRLWQSFYRGTGLSMVASLVAGLATAPFGVFYFNRIQAYSLLANLLEAPITALIVMPALALGTILSSTPLGGLCLQVAGGGLFVIDKIAAWVAGLPGAVSVISSPPDFVLVLAFIGILWVCLVRGPVRWLGCVAAMTIIVWPREQAPDLWLETDGANAAFHMDGTAYALRPKVQQYGYQLWTRRYSLTDDKARLEADYRCKSYVCVPTKTAPHKVGFAFGRKAPKPKALEALCQSSDLVVIRSHISEWPGACKSVNRITASDFERLGAMELRRQTDNQGRQVWHIKAAQPLRGQRPWSD